MRRRRVGVGTTLSSYEHRGGAGLRRGLWPYQRRVRGCGKRKRQQPLARWMASVRTFRLRRHAMAGKRRHQLWATTHSLSTRLERRAPPAASAPRGRVACAAAARRAAAAAARRSRSSSASAGELAERTRQRRRRRRQRRGAQAAEGLRTGSSKQGRGRGRRAAIEDALEIVDIRGEQEQSAAASGGARARARRCEQCLRRAETGRLAREVDRLGTLSSMARPLAAPGGCKRTASLLPRRARLAPKGGARRSRGFEALRKRRAAGTKGGGGGDGHRAGGEGAAEGEAASLELLDREEPSAARRCRQGRGAGGRAAARAGARALPRAAARARARVARAGLAARLPVAPRRRLRPAAPCGPAKSAKRSSSSSSARRAASRASSRRATAAAAVRRVQDPRLTDRWADAQRLCAWARDGDHRRRAPPPRRRDPRPARWW